VPRKTKIYLIIIIIAAAVLRLAAVFKYGNFWGDEMFSFVYSQKPWPEGLHLWLWETNPPLHLLVLKIWLFIFPATEFFARFPSVIAGTAAVYFIFKLGRQIFNKKIGLIAAVYLALHPYHIFWSATARVYSIFILLTVASTYYFFKIYFSEDTAKQTRLIAGAINFLMALSHLSAIFFFFAQTVVIGIAQGRRGLWTFVKNNWLPLGIAYAYVAISLMLKSGNDLSTAWFFNIKTNFANIIRPLINIFIGQANYILGAVIIAGLLLLIILTAKREWVNKNINFYALLAFAATPLLLSAALNVWNIKFFILTLPFFALLVSYTMEKMLGTFFAVVGIIIICSIGLYNLSASLPITDWRPVDNYLQQNFLPAETAIIYNDFTLKAQMERYLPAYTSSSIPFLLYSGMNWDEIMVQKNYLYINASENEKAAWYKNNKLDNYKKIILLQGEADYLNKLDAMLGANGWTAVSEPRSAALCGKFDLYTYEKL
jgi:uncharacterized membrane protein